MKLLIAITILIFLIGCGGSSDPIVPTPGCYSNMFGLNEKGDIIVYPGDYSYIVDYRCEDCHGVEHRENP